MELYVGIALMVLGIVLFFGARSRSKTVRVDASNGSVAIGGNNRGSISNINIGKPPTASHGSHHWLTVIAIVVELAGMAVVIWHALHLAAK